MDKVNIPGIGKVPQVVVVASIPIGIAGVIYLWNRREEQRKLVTSGLNLASK